MAERIDIVVGDKISASIDKKLNNIAKSAEKSAKSVKRLKAAMGNASSASTKLKLSAEQTTRSQNTAANSVRNHKNALIRLQIAQIKSADASKRQAAALNQVNRSAKATTLSFGKLVGAYLAISSAKPILDLADAFTVLQNKVRVVTDSELQLTHVTNQLFDIANRTRTPVEDAARAFTRFDLALQELGATQKQSLELTETVNKALILGGATSGEAAAGLLQLSQAFNKGKADGDEFRSIMELMPLLSKAFGKELGVVRGELLKLAPLGKITAEVMLKAITNATEQINEKFEGTVVTIGQSLNVLRNKFIEFFGEQNKGLKITNNLAAAILLLADNLDIVFQALTLLAGFFATKWAISVALAVANMNPLVLALSAVAGIALTLYNLKSQSDRFFDHLTNDPKLAKLSFDDLGNSIGKLKSELKDLNSVQETDNLGSTNSIIGGITIPSRSKEARKVEIANMIKAMEMRQGFLKNEKAINDALVASEKKRTAEFQKQQAAKGPNELQQEFNILHGPDSATDAFTRTLLAGGNDIFSTTPIKEFKEELKGVEIITGEAVSSLDGWGDTFRGMFADIGIGIADSVADWLVNTESFFTNFNQNWKDIGNTIELVGKEILVSLVSALIQVGTQMIANKLLGSTITAAVVTEQTAAAGTVGAAWAPAATLSSIASFGANILPAVLGIAGAVVAIKGLSGFKSGGFTGNGGVNDVAGVTHGQEFVVNANATRNNRAALENLNSTGSMSGNGQINVTVQNYGSSEITVEQMSPNDVRIIAREVLHRDGDRMIAQNIANPNSDTSKSFKSNTNSERRR